VVSTPLPIWEAMVGSTRVFLTTLSRVSVPSSSVPMSRLYPATSAARTAASRRSTRSAVKGYPWLDSQFQPSSLKHTGRCWTRATSGLGQKRKWSCLNGMSVLPSTADIVWTPRHVCFVPRGDVRPVYARISNHSVGVFHFISLQSTNLQISGLAGLKDRNRLTGRHDTLKAKSGGCKQSCVLSFSALHASGDDKHVGVD
jgi:hypothetical protein